MKKTLLVLILLLAIAIGFNACRQTYENGPIISFRTKMSRITGKWKLVSMEGVPRLNPEIDQYMELTKEKISDGVYKAKFTNFQWRICDNQSNDTNIVSLFTSEGSWAFQSVSFFTGTDYEDLADNEGLDITIDSIQNFYHVLRWKITRLTNKELILYMVFRWEEACGPYNDFVKMSFKKC
ncbi:MAG: hypothetical protein ACOXZK_05975 [Bacteroidales bacterium]